jgi:uncharacterized protein (DUF2062 family)
MSQARCRNKDDGREARAGWMPRRGNGFWDRLARLVKFRLVVPLMRSRHTPEYSARGTAIGLAWAFTPTVGIQMPLVLVTWLIARRFPRWDFSLLLGLAWTWTTNVFTALPCYYLFYVTGRTMLGRWDQVLVKDWGIAMWVGCIPWSALTAFLGYRWSLKFIHAYRHAREHRRHLRHQRRHPH